MASPTDEERETFIEQITTLIRAGKLITHSISRPAMYAGVVDGFARYEPGIFADVQFTVELPRANK